MALLTLPLRAARSAAWCDGALRLAARLAPARLKRQREAPPHANGAAGRGMDGFDFGRAVATARRGRRPCDAAGWSLEEGRTPRGRVAGHATAGCGDCDGNAVLRHWFRTTWPAEVSLVRAGWIAAAPDAVAAEAQEAAATVAMAAPEAAAKFATSIAMARAAVPPTIRHQYVLIDNESRRPLAIQRLLESHVRAAAAGCARARQRRLPRAARVHGRHRRAAVRALGAVSAAQRRRSCSRRASSALSS